MRNMKIVTALLFAVMTFVSCTDSGRSLPSATGTIYEVLVVSNDAAAGSKAAEVMGADMPCLPQMEPYFNVTSVRREQFDDVLKPTRNILLVDVNAERYTQAKVVYRKDVYSHPQAMCVIQVPTVEDFDTLWTARSAAIRQWFVRQEISRQNQFNEHNVNLESREAVQRDFQADMLVPAEYIVIMDTTVGDLRMLWMCNDKGSLRRDLVLYSYPYLTEKMFSAEYQLAKRDSVMGMFVTGKLEGSYMGTEYKHFPPQYNGININGAYAGELRGLWKMYGGAAMGGPFVAISRLDVLQQRILTAEAFVFAPGQKKRNELRKAEAALYSLRLFEEVNSIQQVEASNL